MSPFPAAVRIVDVGPRDGLQNEAVTLPAATKIELIARLAEAIGLERTYLYRKLKTYGIGIDEGRQRDGLGRQ